MIEFLNKLVDSGQFTLLTMMMVMAIVAIGVAGLLLYKILSKIHIKRLKIGNNELVADDDSGKSKDGSGPAKQPASDPVTAKAQNQAKLDMKSFHSVVQQIVDYSIDNGNQASLKRQQLYVSQMRYIKDRFESLRMVIEFDYSKVRSDKSQAVLSLILESSFNKAILSKLEHICHVDGLVEKSQEKLIEEQKSLINNGYISVINELKKYTVQIPNIEFTIVNDELLDIIDKKKDEISKMTIDCLEHSYNEAVTYFNELKENGNQLNESIRKVLMSFLDSSEHESLKEDWYNHDKLPPNEVVGGVL